MGVWGHFFEEIFYFKIREKKSKKKAINLKKITPLKKTPHKNQGGLGLNFFFFYPDLSYLNISAPVLPASMFHLNTMPARLENSFPKREEFFVTAFYIHSFITKFLILNSEMNIKQ